MERSVHWILWITLILIFVLIFPKSCGNKIQVSEENQEIINNNEDQGIIENSELSPDSGENTDEDMYDEYNSDDTIYDEEVTDETYDEEISNDTIYDEEVTDETMFYEENPSVDDSLLEGEMPQLIRDSNLDSNITQKYNCYGFWDGLIARINKNSSIQWCYGICIISPEEIKSNEKIKTNVSEDSFISEIFTSFSDIAVILGIIIGAIIILGIIKYILNKLESLNK